MMQSYENIHAPTGQTTAGSQYNTVGTHDRHHDTNRDTQQHHLK